MVIAFLNPISKIFWSKLVNCNDFNDLIDICVENIDKFSSAIKRIHGSQPFNLESFQVRLVCEGLENYLKDNSRRSSHLLKKVCIIYMFKTLHEEESVVALQKFC